MNAGPRVVRGAEHPRAALAEGPHSAGRRDGPPLVPRLAAALSRHRVLLPVPMLIAAALAPADRATLAWAIGGTLLAGGAALRLAASAAAARDHDRPATRGVFAWVRQPHHLGSLLATIGLAVLAGVTVMLPFVAGAFALAYALVARGDEEALEARFGEEYARYRRRTPRWIPRRPAVALAGAADPRAAWRAERPMLAAGVALAIASMLGAVAR